jgi:hypothetical protein
LYGQNFGDERLMRTAANANRYESHRHFPSQPYRYRTAFPHQESAMSTISVDAFARIASQHPITDVFIAIESLTADLTGQWARLEGGPIIFCFGDICVVFRQPIGCSHIELIQTSLENWTISTKHDYPELATAIMRVFETVCYRKDLNDNPPFVSKITKFEENGTKNIGAILMELSPGGSIGIDASSYGGLVWFLDGQASIFRREYVEVMSLHEKIVWER